MKFIKFIKYPQTFKYFVILLFGFIYSLETQATPSSDALFYKDPLTDTNGLTVTTGVNQNIGFFSKNSAAPATIASECITLNQPSGATFQRWGFLDVQTEQTTNAIQILTVENCTTATPFSTFTVNPNNTLNTQGFDLSGINSPSIRLRWTATGTNTTARLHEWAVYGISNNLINTSLSIPNTVLTGNNFNSTFNFGINGATIPNLKLSYNLTTLNGTPSTGNSVSPPASGCVISGGVEICKTPVLRANLGLMRDATVCYDLDENGIPGNITNSLSGVIGNTSTGECLRYRPVTYVSSNSSTAGTVINGTGTSTNAQDGVINYQFSSLNPGSTGTTSLTLKLPTGYVNNKGVQTQLTLSYGYVSASGNTGLNTNVSQIVNSNQGLSSALQTPLNLSGHYTPGGSTGPGGVITSYQLIQVSSPDRSSSNGGDFEGLTNNSRFDRGTCIPTYNAAWIGEEYDAPNWPRKYINTPGTGTNVSGLTFGFKSYRTSILGQITAYHQVVANGCSTGTFIRSEWTNTIDSGQGATVNNAAQWNIVFESCHYGSVITRRASSGKYYHNEGWPGWPTQYRIQGGSVRPGEYFISWQPYGNEGNAAHTITLDRTYFLSNISPENTFHGYRYLGGGNYVFKDPTGTAPNPDNPAFNHTVDLATGTPHPLWKRMTYQTTPYTQHTGTVADDDNPLAIVKNPGRILAIKLNDLPQGAFYPDAVWRICDGSYNCATPTIGQYYTTSGGSTYTYQTQASPFVRNCSNFGGNSHTVRNVSYPTIYASFPSNNIGSGNTAVLTVQPENNNYASEFTDSKWAVDLSSIANSIDLTNVSGEVYLPNGTAGTTIPSVGGYAGQNDGNTCVLNSSGLPAGIVFRGIGSDPARPNLVWWDVPKACQIPNGMGRPNGDNNLTYPQVYQFRLNIPVKNTTLPGTILTPVTQSMAYSGTDTNGIPTVLGANNMVPGLAVTNYQKSASITVTENPLISGNKQAPNSWPNDNTNFKYVLNVKNEGNTPLSGWYLVDQLPRNTINGSTFSPVYGKVYASEDVRIEYSTESTCFNGGGLSSTWLDLPLQSVSTTQPGYTMETQANIPLSAYCIRARKRNNDLSVGSSIQIGIETRFDFSTPAPGSVYNRSQTGASSSIEGTTTLAPVQTALYRTDINNQFVLTSKKTAFANLDIGNQFVDWILEIQNSSGVSMNSSTAIITDTFPTGMSYQGNKAALPNGVSCTEGVNPTDLQNDGISDCNMYSSNQIRFTITGLNADDSIANSGSDQKRIEFYTNVDNSTPDNTTLTNTADINVPVGGFGLSSTADVKKLPFTIAKTQSWFKADGITPIADRTGTTQYGFAGEKITYTMTIRNTDSVPHYILIADKFAPWQSFVPGSLKLGAATLSDSFVDTDANKLEYMTLDQVVAGGQIVLSFQVQIRPFSFDNTISQPFSNRAYATLCDDRTNVATCSVSKNVVVNQGLQRVGEIKISKTFTPSDTQTTPLIVGKPARVNLTITADNNESKPFNQLKITEQLSNGLVFADVVDLQGTCLSAPVNGTLDQNTLLSSLPNRQTLMINFAEFASNASNQSCTLSFNVKGIQAGTFSNGGNSLQTNITAKSLEAGTHSPFAVYTTSNGNTTPQVTYVGGIDLTITKTANSNPMIVGQVGRFTLTVKNVGTGNTTQPITVEDTLPTGLDYVNASGVNWTCNYNNANRKVTCSSNSSVLSGQNAEIINLDVLVQPSSETQISNTANVLSSEELIELTSNNSSVVQVTIARQGQSAPLLTKSQNMTTNAGSVVWFSHELLANTTSGSALFSTDIIDSSQTILTHWNTTMYYDVNCDAVYQNGTDTIINQVTTPLNFNSGDKKCILVKVFVPQGTSSTTRVRVKLNAEYAGNNAIVYPLNAENLLSVNGNSGLRLTKLVRNVTQNQGFTKNNQVKPNEELEYQVIYENISQEIINDLVIYDQTPVHTKFMSARCGSPLGAGLLSCNVSKQPAIGNQGAIEWGTTGSLNSGGNGSVFFNVNVK